jgi:hypothetical protein
MIPAKSNGLTATNSQPAETHLQTTNSLDCATGNGPSKAIAFQIAELTQNGHSVHQLSEGGYLVSKYGMTHYAPDFEALLDFSKRLGVTSS